MSRRKTDIPPALHKASPCLSKATHEVQSITQTVAYSGPLPSADEMEKYRRISADWPERIIAMAEKEQDARLAEMKKKSERDDVALRLADAESKRADRLININNANIVRGQRLGFLSVLVIIGGACVCAIYEHPISAGIIGSGGIVMLLAAFIIGSKIRIKD